MKLLSSHVNKFFYNPNFTLVQEKRQDREIEGLFTALQNTIENRDSGIEKFRLASEVHLSDIKANLDSVKGVLETVLDDNPTEDLVTEKIISTNQRVVLTI